MLRRSTTPLIIALSCFAIACGGSTADPSASATSGAEGEAPPPPPPPPSDAPEAPKHVPEVTTNTAAAAQVVPVADPIEASSDVYKVVLDSPRMRILEGTWKPGQRDKPHGHPPLVLYALTDLKALGHGESGDPVKVEVRAGQAFFQNAVKSHTFENVGKKKAKALIVELKQGVDPKPMPDGHSLDAVSASPAVYKRVFEDQHVRVLHASWDPGVMDEMHAHPGLAAYFLTGIKAKLHGALGQTEDIEQPAGKALFQDPVRGHMFENTGKKVAQMVLFEPKAPAFGGAGSAAPTGGGATGGSGGGGPLPLEEGEGEVASFVNQTTGVKMDIGGGFTVEIPAGNKFMTVVTFAKTRERPSNKLVAKDFSRHAATLMFDGFEKNLPKPILIGIGMRRMPAKAGQKFVMAMERSGECTKANRKHELDDGGCSIWEILPTEFDEERGKVIGKTNNPGGYRLQFGWMPE